MHRIDIIVPSYGRPDVLRRCLSALLQQSFRDFQILCVCRKTDAPTRDLVAWLQATDQRVCEVVVDQPGFIAALNTGLRTAVAELVAFTDDDAEAPAHWLHTVVGHFDKHPKCGAVGGPDRLQLSSERLSNPAPVKKVGVYSWTGKWHATHHCPIRKEFVKASILKGANMTYRHGLIRGMEIGEGLLTRTCTEPGIAAQVRRAGYELHFVRDAWVLHHCAPRLESDDRSDMTTDYAVKVTYNYAYTLWRYQPLKVAFCSQIREWIVGSKKVPGLVRLFRYPAKAPVSLRHWRTMLPGIVDGYRDRQKQGATSLRV
jgi:GT2 family glycosyltransferase